MRRIVASSAVAGVLISIGAVAAWGAGPDPEGHLDANCPDGSPSGGFFVFSNYTAAQTFTAEHTAWLTSARYLRLFRHPGTNGPVTATVRTVDGTGAPTSTVLATAEVPGSDIPVSSFFDLTVNFGRDAAAVVQGQQYAITLSSTNGPAGTGQDSWSNRMGNQCLGGQAWLQIDGWDDYPDNDLIYETYLGAANDGFGQSRLLEGANDDEEGTTYGATRQEPNEPDHYTMGPDNGWIGDHSVWYRWRALGSGPVTIDTCDAAIDGILAVYTGSALGALTRVTDNNNHADCSSSTPQYGSKVAFDAVAGETYRIAVGDAGGLREARFHLNLAGPGNEKPTVTSLRPAPGSSTADRSPRISARVLDSVTELTEQDITLRVDGNRRNATYDQATDRLRFTPTNNLSPGVHSVQVVAVDEHNASRTRTWSFTVT